MSGDKQEIVNQFAERLGVDKAYGNLLPEDKAAYIERLTAEPDKSVAFVGDGMNDAPVLALSDVGIAMGGLGSDAAIESADVVIQTDQPSKVAEYRPSEYRGIYWREGDSPCGGSLRFCHALGSCFRGCRRVSAGGS